MREFWISYGLFLAKTATLVGALLLVIGRIAWLAAAGRTRATERVRVTRLNDRLDAMARSMQRALLPHGQLRKWLDAEKQRDKERKKQADSVAAPQRKRVFVLDFHGDLRASAVASLRDEVTAVLAVARPNDEVVAKVESGGGLVHAYGLAASQLQRIRAAKVPLTVAVDKVAASGGYMMACVADRVVAAPFAILGSIGVVLQVPNFHRLLERHGVDYQLLTAGEHKRTLTVFGEITDKAKQKAQDELDEAHDLFKRFVSEHRPAVDLAQVATGAHWYGTRALELGLCDALRTSDDYLIEAAKDADVFEVKVAVRKPLGERLGGFFGRFLQSLGDSVARLR
jgi:serine protease SohB